MFSPRDWRLELGYDRERMAAFIGVRSKTWYNYETGIRVPPLDVIVRCQELSGGRLTVESWLAVTLARPEEVQGRLYGVELPARMSQLMAA